MVAQQTVVSRGLPLRNRHVFLGGSFHAIVAKRTTTQGRSENACPRTLQDRAPGPRTSTTNKPAMSHCTYHQKVICSGSPYMVYMGLHHVTAQLWKGPSCPDTHALEQTDGKAWLPSFSGTSSRGTRPRHRLYRTNPIFSVPVLPSPPIQLPSGARKRRQHCQSNR